MSIQQFFKRAFGFSVEDLDEDTDINLNSVDSQMIPTLRPGVQAPAAPQKTEMSASGPLPPDMPVEIIDGILSVINESLPPMIRECLDRDAQRMKLYQAMGVSFKEYVSRLASDASTQAAKAVNDDRARVQAELEQLRSDRKQMEQKRDEQKEQLLSEQRQRRALTERVRDLENKLNSFDAEKEQYQLEIKSLLNKVRVSEVKDADDTELRARIEELTRENNKLKADMVNKEQEINELTAKINELESASVLDQALNARSQMMGTDDNENDTATTANTPQRKKRRRGRPRKEDFAGAETESDLMLGEEVDWLRPGGSPMSSSASGSDSEFGYQPPQRNHITDDENQPTLF